MKKILFLAIAIHSINMVTAQSNAPVAVTYPSGASANIPLPSGYSTLGVSGSPAPTLFNYQRTCRPLQPTTSTTIPTYGVIGYSTGVSYMNGFGQPLQSTTNMLTGDIRTVHDNRTMLNKPSYLPYFSTGSNHGFQLNAFADQKAWYNTKYPNEGDNAYRRIEAVSSGSQHSVASYTAGMSFTGSGRGVVGSVEMNDASVPIRHFQLDANGILTDLSVNYGAGELLVSKTTGEHGAASWEYTNKSGLLVCKRVESGAGSSSKMLYTYYVYDAFGRLAWIVPPKALEGIDNLVANNAPILDFSAIYDGLCYRYKYNKYGQIIEKITPGKSNHEYIVYDRKRRPILSQTSQQFSQGQWSFQIYENQDRVVFSGFISSSNTRAQWVAFFDPNNTTLPTSGAIEYYLLKGCDGAYPNTISYCEINKYNYYDGYSFDATFPYTRAFSNAYSSDYSTTTRHVTPIPYDFVHGLLTATKTRILDYNNPDQWSYSVVFYDQKSRVIQTHTLDPGNTNDWNIATVQYMFTGDVATQILDHYSFTGAVKTHTKSVVHNNYEPCNLGRITSTTLALDNQPAVTLATYNYDELGRVSMKTIGNSVEKQAYTYNIRGQLTGINSGYVYSPAYPDATFGCTLSYDYGFEKPRYDGAISGFAWRGAGSQAKPRAYGYEYDKAGRMTGADFEELDNTFISPPNWNNVSHDYSVSNISYDPNGNMMTMKQRGTAYSAITGTTGPVDMDDLTYHYKPNSNKLDHIDDPSADNFLGDFVDRNTGVGDYEYDENGNLIQDLNKGVTNIEYNVLGLPTFVTTTANGTVKNIYNGNGTLVQKIITPATGPVETYRYFGPFVYKDNNLQYISHGEGRVRWLPAETKYAYDYFVKDHLGNVRSVVNYQTGSIREYLATHEIAHANTEAQIFEGLEKRAPKPGGSGDDVKAELMNGSDPGKRVGTSLLLKVMAGDKFKAEVSAYYDGSQYNPSEEPVSQSSMVSALIGALSGGVTEMGGEAGGTELISSIVNGQSFTDAYNDLQQMNTDPTRPRAYLNYILFDEDMNVIADQSGMLQVTADCDGGFSDLTMPNDIVVGRNGYLLTYMSNESSMDVSMDNFLVTYSRGNLLEEQHYYPHGLVVKDGSNTSLANRYLYQGKALQNEAGLSLYDFHARQYDPQIGRFNSLDPMDQFASGYVGMGNDPANMIDPTGMLANGAGGNSGGGMSPFSPLFHFPDRMSEDGMSIDWYMRGGGGGSGGGGTWDATGFTAYRVRISDGIDEKTGKASYHYEYIMAGNRYGGVYNSSDNALPGLTVTAHSPDWNGWAQAMVAKFGGSLGFDFNGYAKPSSINNDPKVPWIKTANDVYGNGSFLASNALSYIGTKGGRMISMGGSYVFNSSTYSAQKALLQEAAYGAGALKVAGNVLGGIGVGITLYDMKVNGVNTSNSIDLIMGGISFIPGWGWIAGGLYFVGNAALKAGTGKDLGEHISSW